MSLKNFIICRTEEESSLCYLNHHLYMVQKKNNHHPVYLSTTDMKTGFIHDKKNLFDHVIIKHQFPGNYSFISRRLNCYYYNIPITTHHHQTLFQTVQLKNKQWKKFKLQKTYKIKFDINQFNTLVNKKMNNSVNLYWWRNKQFTNIGDELNLYIIGYLSKKIICRTNLKNTDLIGIGSILNWATPRNRIYPVWGSGTLSPSSLPTELFKISLLRGPLTHESLTSHKCKLPYGDPGLICDRIYNPNKEKKYDWGLIVHHSQYKKSWVEQILQNTPNTLFIDITDPDINVFIDQLKSCKYIASSSLHGLVIADSYHIPNIWLWDDKLHDGGKWKFFDYFAGIHRTEINFYNPVLFKNLNHIPLRQLDLSYFDKLENTKNQIIDSFPL